MTVEQLRVRGHCMWERRGREVLEKVHRCVVLTLGFFGGAPDMTAGLRGDEQVVRSSGRHGVRGVQNSREVGK